MPGPCDHVHKWYDYTVFQLKEVAKANNIGRLSTMKKAAIIKKLEAKNVRVPSRKPAKAAKKPAKAAGKKPAKAAAKKPGRKPGPKPGPKPAQAAAKPKRKYVRKKPFGSRKRRGKKKPPIPEAEDIEEEFADELLVEDEDEDEDMLPLQQPVQKASKTTSAVVNRNPGQKKRQTARKTTNFNKPLMPNKRNN